MPPKTKKQLEEENSLLRDKLKDYSDQIKKAVGVKSADLGDDPQLAIGLYKKEGEYYLVKVHYNPENDAAQVIYKEHASRNTTAPHMAKMEVERVMMDEVLDNLEKNDA